MCVNYCLKLQNVVILQPKHSKVIGNIVITKQKER